MSNNKSSKTADDILLSVRDLKLHFPIEKGAVLKRVTGHIRAVDGVNFDIRRGETLGLVGESGCGKSTTARAVAQLYNVTSGEVVLNGADLTKMSERDLLRHRKDVQMVFQDPYASLNPRMTVRDIIAEPLEANGLLGGKAEIDERVREVGAKCKLNVEHLRRFPHAFSGGQRQRICIARALVSNPEFVVCDESVSALDVSIQAEILNLLMDLQQELGLTYLFIAHDLSVVAHISARVAVMYVGQIVELAPTRRIFQVPQHPYTQALLSAIPQIDPNRSFEPVRLEGEIPNPANLPSGCRFHTRCPFAQERCRNEPPRWREIEPEHFVACHFAEDLGTPRARSVPEVAGRKGNGAFHTSA